MKAAVLIIGSLLWDNEAREAWRSARLDLNKNRLVPAAIRYGRRSSARNCTFTMTFDSGDPNGRAAIILCSGSIKCIDDLVAEATALWKAERPKAHSGELGHEWGCVGALFRDSSLELAVEWSQRFQASNAPSVSPVDERGLLCIPWPLSGSDGGGIDVLLATATRPECTKPTAREIAEAWLEHGREEYFFRNVEHGIRTPDDSAIWAILKNASPELLNNPAYKKAVAVLDGP